MMNQTQPRKQTNPRYRHFNQAIYTAGDVDQFDNARLHKDLLPRLEPEHCCFDPLEPPLWSKHCQMTSRSVDNTFKYLFYKFKKGLFVRISNNMLETFLPFSNVHYCNEFSHLIRVEPRYTGSTPQKQVENFIRSTSRIKKNFKIKPLQQWVANNALVRYDENEGDNNVVILQHFLTTLCQERPVPDIEFFLNRRDFPLLTRDGTEPYHHFFGSSTPLVSHSYESYAPIFSCSTQDRYADVAFPTYEDWARATYQKTGQCFPNSWREYKPIVPCSWSSKKPMAVFRGSSTGVGVTPQTNQRLRALELAHQFPQLLDVGITKWNTRPRKNEACPTLQTIQLERMPLASPLTLQQQSLFKYILHCEGHVAAYRLSYELSSGSVILLAQSSWKTWYSHLLQPYKHYIPVNADLSNLVDQIQWCIQHDDECEKIAQHALDFYTTHLDQDAILDTMQRLLWTVARQTGVYSYLPHLGHSLVTDELEQWNLKVKHSLDCYTLPKPKSPRCIGLLDGCLDVFDSKSLKDLCLVKKIFANVNGSIDLYETNQIYLVGKKSNNTLKDREHAHEAFIGRFGINELVGKVPNFAYTFGLVFDNGHYNTSMVFTEFIDGITLYDWLLSPFYSFDSLCSILIQINLALVTAQQLKGFIHYDLYPWNIILQDVSHLEHAPEFCYALDDVNIIIKPSIIPVMIDFGKSTIIIYEEKHGCIVHGFSNLYQVHSSIDSLTLIYGCMSALEQRTESRQPWGLFVKFAQSLGLPDAENIQRWSKFGALFNVPLDDQGRGPHQCIDFIVHHFRVQLSTCPGFFYLLEKGHRLYTSLSMKHVNEGDILQHIFHHMDNSRPVQSENKLFQTLITHMIHRRLAWLNQLVEQQQKTPLVTSWQHLWKLYTHQPEITSSDTSQLAQTVEFDMPKPCSLYLDSAISPQYLEDISIDPVPKLDWISVWIMLREAKVFKLDLFHPEMDTVTRMNGFLYLHAIASHHTALKLKTTL